jgi:hypothetical protein
MVEAAPKDPPKDPPELSKVFPRRLDTQRWQSLGYSCNHIKNASLRRQESFDWLPRDLPGNPHHVSQRIT